MIYYFSEKNSDGTNAGNKARNDVEKILKKRKYYPIKAPVLWKEKRHGNRLLFFLKSIWFLHKMQLPKESYIIIQYPLLAQFQGKEKKLDYSYLFPKLAKKYNLIAVVHDINNLRSVEKHKSTDDLKSAAFIISHNFKMTKYLIQNGIDKNKILNLKIFDYLTKKENIANHINDSSLLCFAGNLAKSKFIYNLPLSVRNLGINLYGGGYDETKSQAGINYAGTFGSEEISSIIKGKYGLIWDGTKASTCAGIVGKYLKYNNPHKLSMYLVANMPVIIWNQAAEAEFVKKNNLGITINSLSEIPVKTANIDDRKYNEMVKNVKRIKEKLQEGYFLSQNLDSIESQIREDKNRD